MAEEQKVQRMDIESTDVMTGGLNRQRYLYYQLKSSISRANQIDIIVSFLMETGVRMLISDLKKALERGVSIRLLTGNYLGITQPSALYLIKKELGDKVDLRFYNETGRSFHPKAYIFHNDKEREIYIGSSNLSQSALTSGIEWNYRFSDQIDPKNFQLFFQTFEELFHNHSIIIDERQLRLYSDNWRRPSISKDLARYDQACSDQVKDSRENKVLPLFYPRGVQIEALYALEHLRGEGGRRGLVQAATGIGKTYLAAFDSISYQRILFVAHREEILKQAAASFRNVRHSEDYGFFQGTQKDTDKSVIFASVASLGKEKYLNPNFFAPEYFDYIVIDEFHHAVTSQYKRIVAYFKPKFMLGLTATPERMDSKDIYELCDYNVPYEISLGDAINKGMLVPFHYYGIYDETDYSGLHLVKGKYDEKELNETYIGNVKRYDLIYKYYEKYPSKRALGFCCSRVHAEEMAKEFSKRSIPSVAVYSDPLGEYWEERSVALEKLEVGEIRVIFSVDMFNEGVDIPDIDMVLFLRPTQSPVVFLQQLGRGLRKAKNKEYLNVLDFIGNYVKAGQTPYLLSGTRERGVFVKGKQSTAIEYPQDCLVDFDLRLIDLFRQMEQSKIAVKDLIYNEYVRVKEYLGEVRPTRMNLFTYMEDSIYQICKSHSKVNPFKRYFTYLKELGELCEEEEDLYNGLGREFLSVLETTDMSKVYKMPVLLCFYNNGKVRMEVTQEELLESWKTFFEQRKNWRDLKTEISYKEFMSLTDKWHIQKIKTMPVKFLKASGKGFFVDKPGYEIALREELRDIVKRDCFVKQMKDIIDYRIMEYYQRKYMEESQV